MSITGVQYTSLGGVSVGSQSPAFPSPVSAGNLLLVVVGTVGATTASVSDTLGNTYTQIGGYVANGTTRCSLWYAVSSSSGANTVTVTAAGASAQATALAEYSGGGATPLDSVSAGSTGSATTSGVTGNLALAGANEMCVGGFVQAGANTSGAGQTGFTTETAFNNGTTGMAVYLIDNTVSAPTSPNPAITWGSAVTYAALGAAFAPGGPTGLPRPCLVVREKESGADHIFAE